MTIRFEFFYALMWYNNYGWFLFSLSLIGSSLIMIEGLTLRDRDSEIKYTTSFVVIGAIMSVWSVIGITLPAIYSSSLTEAESIILFSYFTSVAVIGNMIYILLGVTFIAFSYKNKFSWWKILGISGIILVVSYILDLVGYIISWHLYLFNYSQYANYIGIQNTMRISILIFSIISVLMFFVYTLKNKRFFLSSFSVIRIIVIIFGFIRIPIIN